MLDHAQDFVEDLCNKVSQRVSYQLADLVMGYPDFIRPLVIATVQACLNAQMVTMPAHDRELYDAALAKMTVVTVPPEMDPRKGGAAK